MTTVSMTNIIRIALFCDSQQLSEYLKLFNLKTVKAIQRVFCKNIPLTFMPERSHHIFEQNMMRTFKLKQRNRAKDLASHFLQHVEHVYNCSKQKLSTSDFMAFQQHFVQHYHNACKICINHGLTIMNYLLLKFNDFNQARILIAIFELICTNISKQTVINSTTLLVPFIFPTNVQPIDQDTFIKPIIPILELSRQSSEETDILLQMIETKCTGRIIEYIIHIKTIINKGKQYITQDPFKIMTEKELIIGIAKKCDYTRFCDFITVLSYTQLKVVHIEFCRELNLVNKSFISMRKHLPNCYLFIKSYVRPLVILVEQSILTLVCAKYMIQMLLFNSTIPMHIMFEYIDSLIEKSWNHRNLKIE
jgi:hypothetical protein